MKTYMAKNETMTRKWWILDAENRPLGRVAVEAAKLLRGKHKPTFTPHVDCGDHVIIINVDKCLLTGSGKPGELLYRHSGYPGGLHSISRGEMLEKTPVKSMMKAVKGMLPHNVLGDAILKKLRVHEGTEHGHEAQKPEPFNFE
jgi:large subunit ribosomal protein L13